MASEEALASAGAGQVGEESPKEEGVSARIHKIFVLEDGETWSSAPPTTLFLTEEEYDQVNVSISKNACEEG